VELIRRHTDYALRALVYLAARPGQIISAGEIAASEDMPVDFLQKIFQKFVKSGLVTSHRGAQGGFSLAKDPSQVTMLEVVETTQGHAAVNRCLLGKDGCPRASRCSVRKSWLDVEKKLHNYMREITLQDLVREQQGLG
jgi:Rrf2 family protein